MEKHSLSDIVKKVSGPIYPLGMASEDEKRLNNLADRIAVIENLLESIQYVSQYANARENSVKKIGLRAKKFLSNLNEITQDENKS